MELLPISRMKERIEHDRGDSDTALFYSLLMYAEMVAKLIVASMVACLEENRERHRYGQLHRIIKSNSLHEWKEALDAILTGPPNQSLIEEARVEQRELAEVFKAGKDSWQYEAVAELHSCVSHLDHPSESLSRRISLRSWFDFLMIYRNKTRGHGATRTETCSKSCPPLERSIRLITDNFSAFKRPWAFLHRNLSGKYRITRLCGDQNPFDDLKTRPSHEQRVIYPDGVYAHFGEHRRIDLLHSNPDALDFYLANGGYSNGRYQMLSYSSGAAFTCDGSQYSAPVSPLPPSETEGVRDLDAKGLTFCNLPPKPPGYVERKQLELILSNHLREDIHPVITLVGRGGIGKTSLALKVLHDLTTTGRYAVIIWFSARDIDLLPQGPRLVQPHILSIKDLAAEYVRLIAPKESAQKGFNAVDHLSSVMTKHPSFGPILFVLDNFETLKNPLDIYHHIDQYIRPPNKILITTRIRDFKGDYPVEVSGMTELEFNTLVDHTANTFGIHSLLNEKYRNDLYRETEGHPYVVKILLGEVAKTRKVAQIKRLVASRDDILEALFERTYSNLSPGAKRVFLTLCSWHSVIPQLALEAVLLRPANERLDIHASIDELKCSSLIEVHACNEDQQVYLRVPLAAGIFGKQKLSASTMKPCVESDIPFLQAFGAMQAIDIQHGIAPRVEKLFRHIEERIGRKESIEDHVPMLEFVARRFPDAWIRLSGLYEARGTQAYNERAIDALRHYLETAPHSIQAWNRLATLCRKTNDTGGEIHALSEIGRRPELHFSNLVSTAGRLIELLKGGQLVLDSDEKKGAVEVISNAMEKRVKEATPADLSLLASLYLHLKDDIAARRCIAKGISMDPANEHLHSLNAQLKT